MLLYICIHVYTNTQVNTPCAELLYSSVMNAMREPNEVDVIDTEVATETASSTDVATTARISSSSTSDNSNLLCLDVCSGTGTIGICCAKASMGHMIGVELCQAAVNDAIDNATLNGLTLFTNNNTSSTSDTKEVPTSAAQDVPEVDTKEENDEKEGKGEVTSTSTTPSSNKYECGFICSRAEAVLESLIGCKKPKVGGIDLRPFQTMARGKKVLAVVDPPRGR